MTKPLTHEEMLDIANQRERENRTDFPKQETKNPDEIIVSDMKTKAQKIWNTYMEGYAEALCTPVEHFDTSLDSDSKKIIADVIREVVHQLQYQSFHHTEDYCQLDASEVLELANELETLK